MRRYAEDMFLHLRILRPVPASAWKSPVSQCLSVPIHEWLTRCARLYGIAVKTAVTILQGILDQIQRHVGEKRLAERRAKKR